MSSFRDPQILLQADALDIENLEGIVTKTNFFEIAEKHGIASAELMGRYERR